MNFYFIIIGVLQLFEEISPVNPLTTWLPIVLIFAIAFVREGIDDYLQHQEDNKTNSRIYNVIRDGKELQTQSGDILVGDILILERNQEAPCDIALLRAATQNGRCCIETSNLDGETNPKERIARQETQKISRLEYLQKTIFIRCPPPNSDLYSFQANLFIDSLSVQPIPLTEVQFIQQGTRLKNAQHILGLVCYTSSHTKLGMNSESPPVKWTQIEKFLNKCSCIIFAVQVCLAICTGTISFFTRKEMKKTHKYLHLDECDTLSGDSMWLICFARCYLLTSVMIPISLKVTIDVCKYIYAIWIRNDKNLFDWNQFKSATVNNTSVIEDLGAIEYIFSDKTGTLTENEMHLKALGFAKFIYGKNGEADDIFEDKLFIENIQNRDQEVWMMILNLAFCHSLRILNDKNNQFEGVSPEECAFMEALFRLGFTMTCEGNVFTFANVHAGIDPIEVQLLESLPFSYERRRMSVIIRNNTTQQLTLLTKGAHEKIFSFCDDHQQYENTVERLSGLGLRVMAHSYRDITQDEFDNFTRELQEANADLANRKQRLAEVYEKFEYQQTLIGISGIEDKLQDGVAETLDMLRGAGIKIWMVTGDLRNTAIKIARTTHLIEKGAEIIQLFADPEKIRAEELLNQVAEHCQSLFHKKPFYFVLDGSHPFTKEFLGPLSGYFGQIAAEATGIVCARTMPKQKALFVECIKKLNKVTMAVGDGGNDVTMLRTSHIGIGIIGKEGSQAAVASDFAITQFKFLQRLIMVHGRYSNYRTSWLTQFSFYKSIMLALIQVSYNIFNGWSGISFFNSFNLMCYNAIFTLLPVIFFLVDKDVDEDTVYNQPYVYTDSRTRYYLNPRSMFWWMIRAIYQAVIVSVSIFSTYDVGYISEYDGYPATLSETQQVAYSVLIFIVLLTVTFDTQTFTSLNLIFIWGNWILYLFVGAIANLIDFISMTREMYLVVWRLMSNPFHWFVIILVSFLATLPPFFIQSLFVTVLPTRTQMLRDKEVTKLSKFDYVYWVDMKEPQEEEKMDITIWETSHNLFTPLRFLLCPPKTEAEL